MKFICTNFRYR